MHRNMEQETPRNDKSIGVSPDTATSCIQTDLSIRDRFSGTPHDLIETVFEEFYYHIQSIKITKDEFKQVIKCFPDPTFEFDNWHYRETGYTTIYTLIDYYQWHLQTKDRVQLSRKAVCRSIDFERMCEVLKKKSVYFNSTIPHVWFNYTKNRHYQFDIVRELKFYRSILNGCSYPRISEYYLFLDLEGIPMSQMLSNPKVKAQVGIDFNVYHHCPEISRLLESPLFEKLMVVAECFNTDTVDRIKVRIIAIATCIYNLSRWSASKITTSDLIVNLSSSLAICIPIHAMNSFFKAIFSVTAQSGSEKISLVLKAFFLCLFALIVGKLPGKHTIDEFVNRIHKFPMAFDSIKKFWQQIDPITQTATNYIESELLGYDVIKEKTIMDEVQQWANQVEEYSDLYKKREIAKDKKTMLEAGRLHVDGVRLLSKCLRLHYSRENADLIRALLPTTYKISEIAIRSGADHSKPRREPLIIWFCGKSGVGKSTLTYPFLCDMMKSELGQNEELPENWVQKIYARAPECEYFDGDPTDWMVYDDGFQIRDSIANPSPELFEIIRLGNMFPYMYHKASIEEKGNCFADVKGIVISSNIERIMAESIHCPEAVARRIRYAYKVLLKPEYRLYYTGKDGQKAYRLDKTKVNGPNLSIYTFQPFDPLSGDHIGHPLSYQDMLLQCALALRQLGDEYINYEKWLDDYRKKDFVSVTAQVGKSCPRQAREAIRLYNEVTRHVGELDGMVSLINKINDGETLSNEELLRAQHFFSSEKKMSMLRYLYPDDDEEIEKAKILICNAPVEVFRGPSFDDGTMEEFYRELYENKFLAKIVRRKDGMMVQQVLLSPDCEYIRRFNGFNVKASVLAWLVQRLTGTTDRGLYDTVKSSIVSDYMALRDDPIRTFASNAVCSVRTLSILPWAITNALSTKFYGVPLSSSGTYHKYCKNIFDSLQRFSGAEEVFRTQFPYVQTGAVVEELVEEDVSSVKSALQMYRMRLKKIMRESLAYTRANWPNMLLWTVGTISATYTIYRLIKSSIPDTSEDEQFGEEQDEQSQPQPRYSASRCSGGVQMQGSVSSESHGQSQKPLPKPKVQGSTTSVSSGPTKKDDPKPKVQGSTTSVSSGPSKRDDPKPKVQSKSVEIATSDGRLRPVAQGNISSAVDQQLYSVLDSRVYANTLMAYITPRTDDTVQRRLGHIIALRGSLFMMNYHFIVVLKEYRDYDVVVRQGNNVYHRCTTSEMIENYVRIRDRDLVIFEMRRKGVAFGDLIKHIQTKAMSYSFNVQNVLLARCRLSGMSVSPNLLNASDGYLSVSPISIELDSRGDTQEIVNAESWMYTGVTHNGDCGALLLISNNRVPAKIIGVHNAFDPYRCKAIAVPLYREEVEEAMSFFRPRLQYGWREDFPMDVRALEFNHGENFNVVRCEEGSVPANCKTRLERSPIFEELIPTKTKPGYLRPFTTQDGEVVDPAKKARAKWGSHLPKCDPMETQRATQGIVQLLMKEFTEGSERYKYPLTTEEAIVGVEGVEGLRSINKVSSPGYPYVFDKIPGKGKTGYFGAWEFDLNLPGAKAVQEKVQAMKVSILSNERPFVVWMDTLKDARIPIEKAEAGRTRIFTGGDMAYTILYREYFLPPMAHIMNNRIFNYIAVGINPTSPEWHTLAIRLKSKGERCVANDYSNFDGKAPTEGFLVFLEFVKEWYKLHWDLIVQHKRHVINGYEMSQTEFFEFLDKVFLEVINHVHLMQYEMGGIFYHLFYSACNGQPSGNPGTAITNSICNLFMLLMCWLYIMRGTEYCTVSAFFQYVYACTYGDDGVMNIHKKVIHLYNQNTIQKCMKHLFDIDFTDDKKTGDEIVDSRRLSEVTFLKRSFVFNEDIQMYVSPMEVDTLLDICNWVRTGAEDPRIITINNIASVAAELALVSQEAFDEWLPRLKKCYARISWRVNKEIYFDTRFGYLLAFRNAQFKSAEQ